MNTPSAASVAGEPSGILTSDRACVMCGYNLRGLSPQMSCPECGAPIARSLRGDELKHCSPEYLALLHQGVFLVLSAIIGIFLISILGFGLVFVMAAAAGAGATVPGLLPAFMFVGPLIGLVLSGTLLYGWWLFSSPDPAFTGRDDGARPRRIVRLTVLIQAAAALVYLPLQYLAPGAGIQSFFGGTTITVLILIAVLASIASWLAYLVSFFAQMLYLRWLGPRIPDDRVTKRATMMLWLGPLLYTVGVLLIGLGPLIALVLYWNMLDWVRKGLKKLRAEQEMPPLTPSMGGV